jgi:NADH-quinone oxidoreductase subunit E
MSEQLIPSRPAEAPGLSDEEIAEIDAEIAHAPYRQAVAIDALKIVQSHRRWVSDESLKALAAYLDMSADELDGIATFYNLIFRLPVGEHVILVCNSVSCWIKGCEDIRETLSTTLGVGLGETTPDGRFTLLPVTCLGACDRAPVMMVGDRKFEDVTPERIAAILDHGEGATPA